MKAGAQRFDLQQRKVISNRPEVNGNRLSSSN